MKKHLWECEHDYYCEPCNYFSNDTITKFESFNDFIAEEGDADIDYNLLFRWDWSELDDDDNSTYSGDDYYRNGKLLLFFMGQRKGLYRSVEVKVCRADEPAVIKYLMPRWKHTQSIWAPFTVEAGVKA